MQFSDTSNLNGLIQDITFITRKDLNEYTLKDRTRNLNQWYFRTLKDIVNVVIDLDPRPTNVTPGSDNSWTWANDGTAVRDLVSGTRGYQLPTTNKPWIIYRVAYMRNGSQMYDCVPFHIGSVKGLMKDTDLDSNIPETAPMYRISGDRIFPYPLANNNVSGGLKIWAIPAPAAFASTGGDSVSPEVDEMFHRIITLGASYDYLVSRGKPNANQVRGEIETLRRELMQWYAKKLDDSQPSAKADIPNYA